MRWIDRARMRLRMFFFRKEAASELDAELRDHLERLTEENRAGGMNEREAREAALRAFGNPALLREQTRASWSWNGLESLVRDVRYGLRGLRHAPGFTAIAITVMALGIGANVAIFTVARNVLLKPLPYPEQDRLMAVYEHTSDQFPENAVAGGMYAEWQRHQRSFSNLAMSGEAQLNLSTNDGALPEKLEGAAITANLLPTLGVQPAFGRNFTADEDRWGANRVVILSWRLWKRRFGENRAIVGQTILLNKNPYTVVGIMPKWFAYPEAATPAWTPFYRYYPPEQTTSMSMHNYAVVGRLQRGFTPSQATGDLSRITRRVHDAHLDDALVSPAANMAPLLEDTVGDMRGPILVLFSATVCVLLIACLNVANLLVARTAARRREMAIRTALGGGRLRLVRERMIESLLLIAGGGTVGIALAWGAVTWMRINLSRLDMVRADAIRIDGAVVAFTVGIVLLCSLLAGVIASCGALSKHPLAALQEASRGSSTGKGRARMRRSLLTAEIGLTAVLLIAAGLFLKSYVQQRLVNLGCTTQNVLTMHLSLFGGSYREPAQRVAFYRALLERVRALPGVEGATVINAVPGQGYWGDDKFSIVEHPPLPQGQAQFALNCWADANYFRTMNIPLLRGKSFDANRMLGQANQVIINTAFARKYFSGEDPLGKHLRFHDKNWEIAGVAADTRARISREPEPIQYYPLMTGDLNNGKLVVRSSHDVEALAMPVQRAIQSMDRDLPVSDVMTMEQMFSRRMMMDRCFALLLIGFGVLTLLLAAVGLFGVLSYVVAQRTGELGIRLALGASRVQVLRRVLVDGLKPALVGLVLGLAASVAAVRLIRSMLYQTQPLDPAVFATVGGAMLLVAIAACLLPAWRAAHLNPIDALRTE
jgi:putative ABC transport system permease protein